MNTKDVSGAAPSTNNSGVAMNTKDVSGAATSTNNSGETVLLPPLPLCQTSGTCCMCMGDLQVNNALFSRMICCGSALHLNCQESFFESSIGHGLKDQCPHCQEKLDMLPEKRVALLSDWCNDHMVWAQTMLGETYIEGWGVDPCLKTGIDWYTRAIARNDPNALFALANLYVLGKGVDQSAEKAVELFSRAANQGHDDAQNHLAVMYQKGSGINQSSPMALAWWCRAALQDNTNALNNLYMMDKQAGRSIRTMVCCSCCGLPKTPLRQLIPCGLCHTVQYCNVDYQLFHWRRAGHASACKQLMLAATPVPSGKT